MTRKKNNLKNLSDCIVQINDFVNLRVIVAFSVHLKSQY